MFQPSKLLTKGSFAVLVLVATFAIVLGSWSFTINHLNAARSIGIFPSPADGMWTLIQSGWTGIQDVRIFDVQETFIGGGSHIWFVSACVWAESRVDGSAVGSPTHDFDYPGSYFVNTHEGWVLIPETSSPLFVGFWMKIFGLAGNDIVEPFHDPSIESTPMCVRGAG
jgi:hypothetical protein